MAALIGFAADIHALAVAAAGQISPVRGGETVHRLAGGELGDAGQNPVVERVVDDRAIG